MLPASPEEPPKDIPISDIEPPTVTPTVSNSSYLSIASLTFSAASTVSSKVALSESVTLTETSVPLISGMKLKPRANTASPLPKSRAITTMIETALWRSTNRRLRS